MHTVWSKKFVDSHRDNLNDALSLAKLTAAASMIKLDIADVEVGHSRFRRALLAASTTWRQLVDDASGEWVRRDWMLRERSSDRCCGFASFFVTVPVTSPTDADGPEIEVKLVHSGP
jgi:hypothetical protein